MSRASRHRILAAMLSACLLSLLGGCTPLTVLAVLGGCKDGGSNGSSGGVTGSVTTGEVRERHDHRADQGVVQRIRRAEQRVPGLSGRAMHMVGVHERP